MGPVVHLEHLADDPGVAAELGAPVGVAEHQHRLGALQVVRRDKGAANQRLDAEQVEKVGRDDPGIHPVGLTAVDQIEVHLVVLDQAVEHVGPLAIVEVLGDGDAGLALAGQRRRLLHDDQPIAVLVGQRLQQHAVDHAEDGGVGANAQAKGKNGQRGVAGALDQGPGPVSQVGDQGLEPAHAAGIAGFFLVLLHRSKAPERV